MGWSAAVRLLATVGIARWHGNGRQSRSPWRRRSNSPIVSVDVRWLLRHDLPEVLAIERASFEFPWLKEDFIRCLRQRNCLGMVAEHEDRVVGFMIYELSKTRIDLLNFAVAPAWRRRGVGTQMIAKLLGKLSPQRRARVTLEVRETNLPAQLFFRSAGFRAVSVLREHYEDRPEDAYRMEYRCD